MTIHATDTRSARPQPEEVVFEVPPGDQNAYARHSYHDLMHAWNALVDKLSLARQSGDTTATKRLTKELRHFWPHADAVAHVAWVPDDDQESALPA